MSKPPKPSHIYMGMAEHGHIYARFSLSLKSIPKIIKGCLQTLIIGLTVFIGKVNKSEGLYQLV